MKKFVLLIYKRRIYDNFGNVFSGMEMEPLTTPNPEFVNQLNILERDKIFLIEAGLPKYSGDTTDLSFNLKEETFPYLSEIYSTTNIELSGLRRLGSIRVNGWVFVDENKQGQVVIFFGAVNKIQLVNSSIVQFAECLLISSQLVDMFLNEEKDYEKEEDRDFARNWYQEKIKLIDPIVLIEPENALNESLWLGVIRDID